MLKFNSGDLVLVAFENSSEALVKVLRILGPDPLLGVERFEGTLYPPKPGIITRKVFLTDRILKVFPRQEMQIEPHF